MALTPFGFIAFAIASAAAWAAVLTGVILSPTAERVGPRSATKYGSTFADTEECWAMALIVFKLRSRAPASFLFASCCLSTATALRRKMSVRNQFRKRASRCCDGGKVMQPAGLESQEVAVKLTWWVHRAPQCRH